MTATPPHRGDFHWGIVLALLFALAVDMNHGRWSLGGFAVLMVTFAVLGWRFVVGLRAPAPEGRAGGLWIVLAVLALMPIASFLDWTIIPVPEVRRWTVGRLAEVLSFFLVLSYVPFLPGLAGDRVESERVRNARFALFAALLLVAGVAAYRVSPSPGIDVWTIQMKGADALLEGKNPYVWATVPDTDPESTFTVPYVYPPIAIYAGALARLFFGDTRYALLAATIAAGFALRTIARRRGAPAVPALAEDAPALALWLWPPLVMILDRSWIDPLQASLIAVAVALFVRRRATAAAIVLGLAIASKQSMFWLFPLAYVLFRFDVRRFVVMGVTGLVTVLPFVVWDFRALKYANFDFMAALAPRRDALCFTSFVQHTFGARFPASTGFVLAAAVVVAACVRAPKDPAHAPLAFARAVVATYFAFFFFNRWAFANYYFLLGGLSALTAATAAHARNEAT